MGVKHLEPRCAWRWSATGGMACVPRHGARTQGRWPCAKAWQASDASGRALLAAGEEIWGRGHERREGRGRDGGGLWQAGGGRGQGAQGAGGCAELALAIGGRWRGGVVPLMGVKGAACLISHVVGMVVMLFMSMVLSLHRGRAIDSRRGRCIVMAMRAVRSRHGGRRAQHGRSHRTPPGEQHHEHQ